jgi:hypothetical protein
MAELWNSGDALAVVLSFCEPQQLLTCLPRVSHAFRACVASSPLAWPSSLSLPAHVRRRLPDHGRSCAVDLRHLWSRVRKVELSRTTDVAELTAIADVCPSVERLTVSDCVAVLRVAQERWPRVTDLVIDGRRDAGTGGTAPPASAADLNALLRGWRELRRLTLRCIAISDASLLDAITAHCRNLVALDLSFSQLPMGAPIVNLVAACPLLDSLSLRWCAGLNDESLVTVAAGCPQLRELVIANSTSVSDVGLRAVATDCRHLEHLDLRNCQRVTDASLVAVGASCPFLTSLRVINNPHVTDVGICAIAAGCPLLRQLSLEDCSAVSDASLEAAGEHLPLLHTAGFAGAGRVADPGVRALAHGCPQLRNICLASTSVGVPGVEAIVTGCRNLRELDIRDCDNAVEPDVSTVLAACTAGHVYRTVLGCSWASLP